VAVVAVFVQASFQFAHALLQSGDLLLRLLCLLGEKQEHLLGGDQFGPALVQLLGLLLAEGKQSLWSLLIQGLEVVACQHIG
jgi:hypothetical protein